MATLVEKLQQAALDKDTPVNDLLRRVKLVATKLGLASVEDWVDHELNGYTSSAPPDYRKVHGTPIAVNPYGGPMPIGGHVDGLSWRTIREPVSALEALLNSTASGGTLQIGYPDKVREKLDRSNDVRGWNYYLQVSPSELNRILDRVRTLVLDWTLNLEKAGIMGTNDSFGPGEKQKAQASATTINVSGNITLSVLKTEQVASIISQLRAHRDELVGSGADGLTLDERLDALEKTLAKPHSDDNFIRGLLTDLRNCLSGAAGSLVATGAIQVLNVMLGTGVPAS